MLHEECSIQAGVAHCELDRARPDESWELRWGEVEIVATKHSKLGEEPLFCYRPETDSAGFANSAEDLLRPSVDEPGTAAEPTDGPKTGYPARIHLSRFLVRTRSWWRLLPWARKQRWRVVAELQGERRLCVAAEVADAGVLSGIPYHEQSSNALIPFPHLCALLCTARALGAELAPGIDEGVPQAFDDSLDLGERLRRVLKWRVWVLLSTLALMAGLLFVTSLVAVTRSGHWSLLVPFAALVLNGWHGIQGFRTRPVGRMLLRMAAFLGVLLFNAVLFTYGNGAAALWMWWYGLPAPVPAAEWSEHSAPIMRVQGVAIDRRHSHWGTREGETDDGEKVTDGYAEVAPIRALDPSKQAEPGAAPELLEPILGWVVCMSSSEDDQRDCVRRWEQPFDALMRHDLWDNLLEQVIDETGLDPGADLPRYAVCLDPKAELSGALSAVFVFPVVLVVLLCIGFAVTYDKY
jgi:hypothetical protein